MPHSGSGVVQCDKNLRLQRNVKTREFGFYEMSFGEATPFRELEGSKNFRIVDKFKKSHTGTRLRKLLPPYCDTQIHTLYLNHVFPPQHFTCIEESSVENSSVLFLFFSPTFLHYSVVFVVMSRIIFVSLNSHFQKLFPMLQFNVLLNTSFPSTSLLFPDISCYT
jgi:hypothetical protein